MATPHKHAELIKAWADGAVIQHKDRGQWCDANQLGIIWSPRNEYRIKPEVTTSLSDSDLQEVFDAAYHKAQSDYRLHARYCALRAVADAAIKQYIKENTK